VGDIGGNAGETLARELARLASGSRQSPTLTGNASFALQSDLGDETAVTLEAGDEKVYYERDPLTNQVWLARGRDEREILRDFPLVRAHARLVFNYELRDPATGGLLRSGSLSVAAAAALGGFLGSKAGQAPTAAALDSLEDALLKSLSQKAASDATEIIGPLFGADALAPASDPASREAKALVGRGDWEAAKIIWEGLVAANPLYAPAQHNLGLYHEGQGDLPEAWRLYRLAFLADQSATYRDSLARVTEVLRRAGALPRSGRPTL
jgi:tetratricopeptide (TPR) repeat protein